MLVAGALEQDGKATVRGVSIPDLRALRQVRGLTRAELARQAGVSPATITRLETGQRLASIRILRQLAPALGLSVGDLLRHAVSAERPPA